MLLVSYISVTPTLTYVYIALSYGICHDLLVNECQVIIMSDSRTGGII